MAEAAVEPRVTEAGPVEAVTAPPVGTVALLATMFAIETLGATWEQGSVRWISSHRLPLGGHPSPWMRPKAKMATGSLAHTVEVQSSCPGHPST